MKSLSLDSLLKKKSIYKLLMTIQGMDENPAATLHLFNSRTF